MKLSRRIKNAKRTKRTKRTKRKNHTKLRRKTKQQFRQYRRKNTYHKHSHKLKQNKRVHRGGEGENLLSNRQVELQYTTDDSSWINRARGVLNKLQTGTFTCNLSYSESDSKIDDTVFSDDVYTKSYSREDRIVDIDQPSSDKYIFILSMKKEDKEFTVKFTVTVKKYKITNSEVQVAIGRNFTTDREFSISGIDYGTTYEDSSTTYEDSSTSNIGEFHNSLSGITIKDMKLTSTKKKNYTFPLSKESINMRFFNDALRYMYFYILEIFKQKMIIGIKNAQTKFQDEFQKNVVENSKNRLLASAATSTSLDATVGDTDSPLAAIPTVTPTDATVGDTDSPPAATYTDENTS